MAPSDEHMQERAAEKQAAIAALRDAFSVIERDAREPDQWERAYIHRALRFLVSGAYGAVPPEVEYALEPPAKRRPEAQPPINPELDRLDLATMRRELAAAERLPLVSYNPSGLPGAHD